MATTLISDDERLYIIEGVECNVRNDGRTRDAFRRAQVDFDIVPNAHGSSRVSIGGSDVIVSVKLETGMPAPDAPDMGILEFSVECSPLANPSFRGRGGDDLATHLTKTLERSLFVSKSSKSTGYPLKLDTLSIISGKICWIVHVDALVLDLDANIHDVVSIATKAALAHTRVPHIEIISADVDGEDDDYEVDDDPELSTRLDVSAVPLTFTICQLGSKQRCCVDPTIEEYSCASAALHVSVDAKGTVCGIAKERPEGLETAMMMEMISLAQSKAPLIHQSLDEYITKALANK